MIKLLIGLFLLSWTLACSTRKSVNRDRLAGEPIHSEDFTVIRKLRDEFKGDYLLYSGQSVITNESGSETSDSLNLTELAVDKDNRFTIRITLVDAIIKTDTTESQHLGATHNTCFGEWKDKGDKIELHFLLGSVDGFFDLNKNKNSLQAVNETTVLLHKSAEEIWIWKSLCKRK